MSSSAPDSPPLFDTAFRQKQRERWALDKASPARLYGEAQARLKDRLADVARSFTLVRQWEAPETQAPADLILSCLSLQNENNLPEALATIRSALTPDGLFLGVMAGGATLQELRAALMEAELALTGRVSPRVAPMVDLRTAGQLLLGAGFALPVADEERMTLVYSDLFALMQDLRHAGAANALSLRSRLLTPRGLFTRAAEIYARRFPGPNGTGIAVTVDLLFLHGWKTG